MTRRLIPLLLSATMSLGMLGMGGLHLSWTTHVVRELSPSEKQSLRGGQILNACCEPITDCQTLPTTTQCSSYGNLACTRITRTDYYFTKQNNQSCTGMEKSTKCTEGTETGPCIVSYRCYWNPNLNPPACTEKLSSEADVESGPTSCSPSC